VASTRVESLGNEGWKGCGRSLGRGKLFCFVISKWRIWVNSDVLNLKLFYRELPQYSCSEIND